MESKPMDSLETPSNADEVTKPVRKIPKSLSARSATTGSLPLSRPSALSRHKSNDTTRLSFLEDWGNPDSILPSNFDVSMNSSEKFSLSGDVSFSGNDLIVDSVSYSTLIEESPTENSSALHDAARITNWESVIDLCKSSPHLASYTGPDKWTALHHACNRRPPADVVEVLLRAYPDALLEQDEKGWTPLHHACRFKASPEVVRFLLKMFPSRGKLAASTGDNRGRPPLYYSIRYEAPDGVMEMLLDADPSAVLEEDRNGEGPMFLVWDQYAISNLGKKAIQNSIEKLTRSSENTNAKQGGLKKGTTLATKWDKVNILLRAGTRNNQDMNDSGMGRWRILHVSSAVKCHSTLFNLARALHPEQVTEIDEKTGRTCLHCAVAGEMSRAVVTSLLEAYPEAASIRDILNGSFPLHLAVENEKSRHWVNDNIRAIYNAYPEAIKTKDLNGRTPLHIAAAAIGQSGYLPNRMNLPPVEEIGSIIFNLLQSFSGASKITDNEGKLPFHLVAEYGEDWSLGAEQILKSNSSALRTRVTQRGSSFGLLPIHMAAMSPDSKPSLIENILKHHPRGATQPDGNGKLSLHLACESGKGWDLGVETIYKYNPSAVKSPDDTSLKWMPLHYAAASPNADSILIQKLLELNPEAAEVPDQFGRYALHLACASGKSWDRGVKLLFEINPFSISHADSSGWLPLHATLMSGIVNSYIQSSKEHNMNMNEDVNDYEDISKINTVFELLLRDPNVLRSNS